jgi:hypothetical protein
MPRIGADIWAEESRIFEALRIEVAQKLDPDDRVLLNRYFDGSPIYPAHFSQDFNRSYVLEPVGPPIGAVVLLYGLTDSPFRGGYCCSRYRILRWSRCLSWASVSVRPSRF